MNWTAILLWLLKQLSFVGWLHRTARILLGFTAQRLNDPAAAAWMRANPDHPDSFPRIERQLGEVEAYLDFVLYQHARAILGLRRTYWTFVRSPPQRRRSQTFEQLYARYEACALRLADMDRLALRRADKLKQLFDQAPVLGLDPAHTTFTATAAEHTARERCLPQSPRDWGRWIARSCARDGGGLDACPDLRIRAPP